MAAVTKTDKMICPNCGVEMNHHCDKLMYTTDPENTGQDDSGMGGTVEEFHTCPKCGGGASRHAFGG